MVDGHGRQDRRVGSKSSGGGGLFMGDARQVGVLPGHHRIHNILLFHRHPLVLDGTTGRTFCDRTFFR